jgi:hypothetical protein
MMIGEFFISVTLRIKKTLPGGSVLLLVWYSGQSGILRRQLLVSTLRASR